MSDYIREHIYTVYFDGVSLSNYGVHTSGNESYRAPERDKETVEVPGKNGDLHFEKKRFKNVTVSYPAFIADHLEENVDGLLGFLGSSVGYKRLEDTYHKDYYRLGRYDGPFDPDIILLQAGAFTLEFDCKPQKFLISGEDVKTYTGANTIYNPTRFNAKPIIRVYGNGNVGIGHYSFTTTNNANNYIDIDCDLMDCYRGTVNCNDRVTFTDHEIPEIVPGSNGITLSSTITKIEITPRWWTI